MTITARSTPYRETNSKTYTCRRCGCERSFGGSSTGTGYCTDCRSYAKADGWL